MGGCGANIESQRFCVAHNVTHVTPRLKETLQVQLRIILAILSTAKIFLLNLTHKTFAKSHYKTLCLLNSVDLFNPWKERSANCFPKTKCT